MFSEFPTAIHRICLIESEAELLGSPIIGYDHFFDESISKPVKCSSNAEYLPDLNNSQIEFHLRSCLGLCKINHILRTVHPNHTMSRSTAFDAGLRHSLEILIHASLLNHAWQQVILPMSLGDFGFRQAKQLHQQLSFPVAISNN